MPLRSKMFSDNPAGSKSFVEDLLKIAEVEMSANVLQKIPPIISSYFLAPTRKGEALALADLRDVWSIPEDVLESVVGIGSLFLRDVGEADTIDDVIADLRLIVPSIHNKIDRIQPFIAALLKESQENFASIRRIYRTQQSGLPVLKGMTHLVDLRAVIQNEDDLEVTGPDKYRPKIERLVPVAIFQLRLGTSDPVTFQMDRRSLDILVDDLQGLQKEMDAIMSFVPKNTVHPGRMDP